jgi:hypothetical protein
MTRIKINEDHQLKTNIDKLLLELSTTDPKDPHHDVLIEKLEKLNALRTSAPEKRKPVDPNALINAGASIAGILVIVGYEHAHVVGSKALAFVLKK